jgi:hypothetical protein
VLDMLEQSSAGCGGGDDRQMSSFRLEMCLIYLNKLISGGNLLTNRQCIHNSRRLTLQQRVFHCCNIFCSISLIVTQGEIVYCNSVVSGLLSLSSLSLSFPLARIQVHTIILK